MFESFAGRSRHYVMEDMLKKGKRLKQTADREIANRQFMRFLKSICFMSLNSSVIKYLFMNSNVSNIAVT